MYNFLQAEILGGGIVLLLVIILFLLVVPILSFVIYLFIANRIAANNEKRKLSVSVLVFSIIASLILAVVLFFCLVYYLSIMTI